MFSNSGEDAAINAIAPVETAVAGVGKYCSIKVTGS